MTKEVVLNEVPVQHVAAKVVFQGEKITLPQGMAIPTAITTLQQFAEAQEAAVSLSEGFEVFPWDGAFALRRCLEKRFGFVNFNGREMRVEVAPGVFDAVPWGTFDLPDLARFTCSVEMKEGRWCFRIAAGCRRKAENVVKTIFKDVRDYLNNGGSIYQGKAIKLRLEDDQGNRLEMPEPKFIDTREIDVSKLMFNKDVQESIQVSLYTPIARVKDLKAAGLQVKRTVVLGGTYGTGKTLVASAAAKLAVENGVTMLYIKRASELAGAIDFIKMYSKPAGMIFCEDIDRGDAAGNTRSVKMDDLLNIIDGIDTKNSNIITVLTTNDANALHPGMLRPGRLDAVIHVTPPDRTTAERILRSYCGDSLNSDADVAPAASLLAGQIPAVLAECVKRAKLAQLSLQEPGEPLAPITGEALFLAAQSMQGQLALLQQRIEETQPKKVPELHTALEHVIATAMQNGAGEALGNRFGWN